MEHPSRVIRWRLLAESPEQRVLLAGALEHLGPAIVDGLAASRVPMPRGIVIVGHARPGHPNAGELTTRPRGFVWLWLDASAEAQTRLPWIAAHEAVHLLVAGASGWPRLPGDSTMGQRIAGEYLAERFAPEVLAAAGMVVSFPAYEAAEVHAVMSLVQYARRKARRILDGDCDPRDPARLHEAVRVLARDYAYALGLFASAGDRGAGRVVEWLPGSVPLIARIVDPLRQAHEGLADGFSAKSLAAFQEHLGGEIDRLLGPALEGLSAAQELAA